MDRMTERIVTVVTVLAVVGILAGMAVVAVMSHNGSMDPDAASVTLGFLSMTLTTVVILFGALALSTRRSDDIQRYLEEKEKRGKE